MSSSSVVLAVRRTDSTLITPLKPTPSGLKLLSLIDDQPSHRYHSKGLHLFPSGCGDPVGLYRNALAKALTHYYPFAGRLREMEGGRLAIDCTGEGALFIEAEADVSLDQLAPYPPFAEDLVPGFSTTEFLTAPLLAVQLTRLRDGGIVLSHSINHTVADGAGMAQFIKSVGELARGENFPTIMPVWQRELLSARDPPCITHAHPEYDILLPEAAPQTPISVKSVFFGPSEMTALQQQLPPESKATRFELLTAALWRSNVVALETEDEEEVRARFTFNIRNKCTPMIPEGYYGNGAAYVVVRTSAYELKQGSLQYAVELVKAGKDSIKDGYLQSVIDLLAERGGPMIATARTLLISDVSRIGFDQVDFGWGSPVYAGPVCGGGPSGRGNFFVKYTNSKGEDGVLVPLCSPTSALPRLEKEIHRLLHPDESTTASTLVA